MAALGVLTGLISSLPSPLPDLQLSEPEILISARTIPIHAGVAFGAMLGGMLFLWVNRHPGKCALAMVLTLLGWLVAVNTANDVTSAVLNSELFGTVQGAKADREILGWLLAGLCAGAVGAGLTAFGAGIPAASPQAASGLGTDRGGGGGIRASALSGRGARHGPAAVRAMAGCGRRDHCLWPDLAEDVIRTFFCIARWHRFQDRTS